MQTFEEYLKENSDLEEYRKHALQVIRTNKDKWKHEIERHLGKKVHKVEAHGSVTDKKRFRETSDIDILVHTKDKNRPHGPDHDASQFMSGKIHHPHTGHLDVGVFNHNLGFKE